MKRHLTIAKLMFLPDPTNSSEATIVTTESFRTSVPKKPSVSETTKDGNGMTISDKQERLSRWAEYFEQQLSCPPAATHLEPTGDLEPWTVNVEPPTASEDGHRVTLIAPGWRHYKIWLSTDVSGVLVVSFYPDCLNGCLYTSDPYFKSSKAKVTIICDQMFRVYTDNTSAAQSVDLRLTSLRRHGFGYSRAVSNFYKCYFTKERRKRYLYLQKNFGYQWIGETLESIGKSMFQRSMTHNNTVVRLRIALYSSKTLGENDAGNGQIVTNEAEVQTVQHSWKEFTKRFDCTTPTSLALMIGGETLATKLPSQVNKPTTDESFDYDILQLAESYEHRLIFSLYDVREIADGFQIPEGSQFFASRIDYQTHRRRKA
ncbi:hypothetical protein CLF_106171 [Clonorchis sinensis]|uniref:Uncharacterized protein n=1 Tax=Clonorchis sinensis TaxID=79923 RepID=G7YPR4_CLOSI|nr:hypothetical protein CLF_106171 [Clonorchis sinensis]